jgi:hypothetical protein
MKSGVATEILSELFTLSPEPVPLRQPAPKMGLLHEKGLRLVKPLLLATVATLGLAAALPASATPTITVQVGPAPYTAPTSIPFTLDPLGTSSLAGYVGQSISPVGGETFSFQDPSANPPNRSGVYAGNTPNIALSPFGASDSTSKYLVAQGGGGTVTINFASPQTSFNLLWGTVDTASGQNNLEFNFGGQTITGQQILNAVQGSLPSGQYDTAVEITGLASFTQLVAHDYGDPAFEFVPGVDAPAPEPASLALFGVGLLGLGMVTKRRRGV